jgi:hypothetical protein
MQGIHCNKDTDHNLNIHFLKINLKKIKIFQNGIRTYDILQYFFC